MTKVTEEERKAREALFVVPEDERNPESIKKTLNVVRWMAIVGVLIAAFLLIFWAFPYLKALH